ncbi:MAG: T9SS type A sorting domain-containing protein [Ignavibacteriaceae bacterium]|nr:T9SS type A sorting domain-containing protein [Ignavibacteriaceae bacterium]
MNNKITVFTIFILSALLTGLGAFTYLINDWNTSSKTNEKVSGAFHALEFWNMVRAYPEEDIPADGFMSAFEQAELISFEKQQNTYSVDPWYAIGPHNTGGRTNAITFNPQNPNTIYVGSASGGLWRSYTGGVGVDAWHYVSTGFPVLGVSSITITSNDSSIIYIGTGEVYNYSGAGFGAAYRSMRGTYGMGILKSTDGGQTWSKSLDWAYNSGRGVWAVEINPLNPNTVWAATTEGIYRSYDAGSTWQQVHNVIMGMSLVINPVDTNIVISGHGNFASTGFGIYRTTDGGTNWAHITSGLPTYYEGKILLDIYKANPNIVYASIGNGFSSANGASWLCKSTDAGLNWSIMSQVDYSKWQGWFSHDVSVDQSNPDNLIVIGIEVYKSTNGGSTVVQKSSGGLILGRPPIGGQEGPADYTHSDAHVVAQHPTDMNTYYIGTDGGIFRTIDFGETYQSHNGRLQTTQFYNGTSSSQTDSLKAMGGLQDNSTVIYDGDLAWIRVIGGDGSWTSIDPSNDNIVYASWQNLNMRRSTNGGSNFSTITPPSAGITAFIAPFRTYYNDASIIYAGRDKIFKSTNSGNSWTATNNNTVLDGNPALAMDISYQSEDIVYVATAPFQTSRGNVFRTTNGGAEWTNITGNLPDRFPSDMAVDPLNDNVVFITFYGFGSGHVFKSTNSGDNWTDVSDNLPDVPVPAVIVDPNNTDHVYIGTDIGVFVSTDGGGNWQDFNNALPDGVQGMDLNICRVNNVLRVMTHGNGAYERKLLSTIVSNSGSGPSVVINYQLGQNYPNPFNPSTTIEFKVQRAGLTTLKVYDVIGNQVATLVERDLPAGDFSIDFDASNLTSGTYLYRLESGNFVETKKMILLK